MAERDVLEAVLFDAGGTLVRLDFEWMADALCALGAPVDAEALRRGEIEGRRRYDASRNRASDPGGAGAGSDAWGDIHEYFGGMLEAAGVPRGKLAPALERFFDHNRERGLWDRPMEGARAAIDGCAALGLRRAVVSNSDGRAERHLASCGVLEGIEFVVDSRVVGVEKPDPAIVRIALDRLGVAPGRALFVGDFRSIDETVARSAGTRFVLIDPYRDYAPPGCPAIAGMHGLAAWIGERFVTPRPARAARVGGRNRHDAR